MRKTKRELNLFLSFDYEGLETHLEKMAQKGWRLTAKSTPRILHYERIEPAKLHAAVVCLKSVSEFTPLPNRKQEEMIAYCENAGWSFAASYAQVHIFYSDQENPVFPETDEAIRLKAIHQSMWREFLAWAFILFAGGWMIWDEINACIDMPTRWAVDLQWLVFLLWIILMTDMFSRFVVYFYWYLCSRYAVKHGRRCRRFATRLWKCWDGGLAAIGITAAMFVFVFDQNPVRANERIAVWLLGYILLYSLIMYLAIRVSKSFRKSGIPGWINLAGTILIAVAAVYVLQYISVTRIEMPEQKSDGMPLRIEHIGADADRASYESWKEEESFAAYAGTGWQRDASGEQLLYYVIMDVKYKPIYELCFDRWFRAGEWIQTDDAIWNADFVYEQEESERTLYFVGTGSKLLYLVYERVLTDREIMTVAERCLAEQTQTGRKHYEVGTQLSLGEPSSFTYQQDAVSCASDYVQR